MATPPAASAPHRRFNPLLEKWVLCSPHRLSRPWNGEGTLSRNCFACNISQCARATGDVNPDYHETFVFTNDFSAVLPTVPELAPSPAHELFRAVPERGTCRVICFSPRHDLTLAEMEVADIERVVATWTEQYRELGALEYVNHVQIFENKGAMMGCSNPHPHGQIWAQEHIPVEPETELMSLRKYRDTHDGKCMLCEYAAVEQAEATRTVAENTHFIAVVPYWAAWPFEVLVLAKAHLSSLLEFTAEHRAALASVLKTVSVKYDNLFQTSFPYSFGLHQATTPTGQQDTTAHFHAHFYPPLLRSATVRKFMVGYEMMAEPQRDLTAEAAAAALRRQADEHYLQQAHASEAQAE